MKGIVQCPVCRHIWRQSEGILTDPEEPRASQDKISDGGQEKKAERGGGGRQGDESQASGIAVFQCVKNTEKEEATAMAKASSFLPEDPPPPSLSGITPPNPMTPIHVQSSGGAEGMDVGSEYIEGKHWVKGMLIGTAGFSSYFLARDTELGTMMAVKQVSYVRNTKSYEEAELKRLFEEVTVLGEVSHPNIVRCLGATQYEGHINIFLEWMSGGCLDDVLHNFGPLAESVICNYTRQIIHGIAYLHEHRIVHRDINGGNILLDSTGQRVRLTDFGSAVRLASSTGEGEIQDMQGTFAFMAPEVARGTGSIRKCDIWSIGCVIIQMATAKPPWAGTYNPQNKYQLLFKIGMATGPPPMPRFSNPALKDLTLRCLEVNTDDRPTSSELLQHPLFTSSSSSPFHHQPTCDVKKKTEMKYNTAASHAEEVAC
jgi:mitogen-activated protein kinase kinase kinase 1